jgi:hypothetical protein
MQTMRLVDIARMHLVTTDEGAGNLEGADNIAEMPFHNTTPFRQMPHNPY